MIYALLIFAIVLLAVYQKIKDTVFFGKLRFVFYEGPRMLFYVKSLQKRSGKKWSFVNMFEEKVDKNPDLIQFITVDDDKAVTLGGMERLANQIAHWALAQDLHEHDSVSLMMLNRPELAIFWLGMAKIGVSTALINSNITGKGFIHSAELPLKDTKKKILVIDGDLKNTLQSEVATLRQNGVQIFFWDELDRTISALPTSRPSPTYRQNITERDTLIYIFTSGTTGLPKACKLSSTKFLHGCSLVGVLAPLTVGDRFYNVLPLYHSAGGMLALGGCMLAGATMVLRMKFSVRSFTPDIVKYKCAGFQYIGELCRYLANAPPNAEDAKVTLKFAIGNGMRPDVWVKFQKRYNVKRIIEFYGATEGNVGSFNSTGKVGALGYMPSFLSGLKSIKLLRVDPDDKSIPLRNSDGFCTIADFNEPGLLTSEIDPKVVNARFDGYSDKESTDKKILRDVFKSGDRYFNTGDLLTKDAEGFLYWCDRVGDTFRWKGENVATTEIENALSAVDQFADVTVYGVPVPDYDGKVGMAAVVLSDGCDIDTLDWSTFHKECSENLTSYSRPAFVRVQVTAQVTATFKHQKNDLVKDGYNPAAMKDDKLFFYDQKLGQVRPLDVAMFERINTGKQKI